MDARRCCLAALIMVCLSSSLWAQRGGAKAASPNFVAIAGSPQLAQEVVQAAEQMRRDLALRWLGRELPNWASPCPIRVMAAPNRGAGGKTTFTFVNGTVTQWEMEVEGSRERILDSVLPHEITHTVFATHFAPLGKPVPRWADEGACTTVEHVSEKSKHDHFLVEFLSNGRGIAFATMFTLRDYPHDIMPLYAQGYSVASFLIAQGGERRFVAFLEDGMQTDDWVTATEKHYAYPGIGKLQSAWNAWVGNGGGRVDDYSAIARGLTNRRVASLDQNRIPNNDVRMASNVGPSNPIAVSRAFDAPQPVGQTLSDPPSMNSNGQGFYQQQLELHSGNQQASNGQAINSQAVPSQPTFSNGQPTRLSDTGLPQYNVNR